MGDLIVILRKLLLYSAKKKKTKRKLLLGRPFKKEREKRIFEVEL